MAEAPAGKHEPQGHERHAEPLPGIENAEQQLALGLLQDLHQNAPAEERDEQDLPELLEIPRALDVRPPLGLVPPKIPVG